MLNFMPPFLRRTLLAVAAAALLVPGPSHAQLRIGAGGWGGGPGNAPVARISRQALDRYATALTFDPAQSQAAAALHEAYTDSNRNASSTMHAKMKELNPKLESGDSDAIHIQLPAIMQQHAAKVADAEQSFLADLKALLTLEQADTEWPKFERLRRREQGLRSGVLSGSNIDLLAIVDKLQLPAPAHAKLADTLAQYEQDLDRAFTEIAAARTKDKPDTADGTPRVVVSFDPAAMRTHLARQRDDSIRIRAINQRYARLLGNLLEGDLKALLDEQCKLASFKNIYRESAAGKKLAAAGSFDDLTPEQRTKLDELRSAYTRSARAAGDRWSQAHQEAEAAGKTLGGPGMVMRFNDDTGGPDELAEARQARRDLDQRAAADLNSLLTDDQKSRLPNTDLAGRVRFKTANGEDLDMLVEDDDGELAEGEGGHGGAIMIRATHNISDDGTGTDPTETHSFVVTTSTDEPQKRDDATKDKKKKDKK